MDELRRLIDVVARAKLEITLSQDDRAYIQAAVLTALDNAVLDCANAAEESPMSVDEQEDLLAGSGLPLAVVEHLRAQGPRERAAVLRRTRERSAAQESDAMDFANEVIRKYPVVREMFRSAHDGGLSWTSMQVMMTTPQEETEWLTPLAWLVSGGRAEVITALFVAQLRAF